MTEACIAGDQAGVLRVGVAYTRSRAIMPPIVKAMQRDCPNIIVELIEGRNDQIQQWLANGDLDLAVADFAGKPAGIELMDFYNERMVLVLAQSLWKPLWRNHQCRQNGKPQHHELTLEHCPLAAHIDGRIADSAPCRFEPKYQPVHTDTSQTVPTVVPLLPLPALNGERLRTLPLVPGFAIQFGVPATSYRWSVIDDFNSLRELRSHIAHPSPASQ